MVPSAERQNEPFPPVEMLPPASVDRFPCFHTCPAYEQKKRAIPGQVLVKSSMLGAGTGLTEELL